MTLRGRLGILGTLAVAGGLVALLSLRGPLVTSARAADNDGDGLQNALETALGTNLNNTDTDGDGLNDFDEVYVYGTNPCQADTDGDGVSDGVEGNTNHTDPLVNTSTDGTATPTSTWSENLTAPAATGASTEDGKGIYVHSGEF